MVRALLERLTQDAPSAATGWRWISASVCGRRLKRCSPICWRGRKDADAHAIFEWLSQLLFIEQGPFGLFPHDLAREALDADWRWRNPEGFRQLTYQLFANLYAKFAAGAGQGTATHLVLSALPLSP